MPSASSPGSAQAAELFAADDAMGSAEVDGEGVPHLFIGSNGLVKFFANEGTSGCDNGKAVDTGFLIFPGVGST